MKLYLVVATAMIIHASGQTIPPTEAPTTSPPSPPPLSCTSCTPDRPCFVGETYYSCMNWPKDKCNTGFTKWCGFTATPTTTSTATTSPPTTTSITVAPTTTPPSPPLTCNSCTKDRPCFVGEPYWSCMAWTKEQCNTGFSKGCDFTPSPTPVVTPSLKCHSVQTDVDYYGFDLSQTSRKSADDCCGDCESTPGCKLFVWSDHNGGTCWLKHTKGKTSKSPGAKSGMLIDTAPFCGNLEWNVDYPGNDIDSTNRASADECCVDCKANSECKLFVWTDFEGGTCWLKAAKGKKTTHSGAKSAVVQDTCSKPEFDVDYDGNDVGSTNRATPDACCADCKANKDCKLFLWTDFEGGTCWLKSAKGAASESRGAYAAAIYAECGSSWDANGVEQSIRLNIISLLSKISMAFLDKTWSIVT
ncbi:unnamed protein product [Aphanomyces euteiches]|uniref:Apple domain-containing protein n=1 Tax=Aphanomyces euteiches TaxID=100861 RepID=A0A6G0X2V8_9STRA|nr:hypothetical protein Ae201684_009094 [Aphanomyces euteiches]KAH9073754.1 hypothetical protein Ae201684P_003257 [Aphanomyces euteiches]